MKPNYYKGKIEALRRSIRRLRALGKWIDKQNKK